LSCASQKYTSDRIKSLLKQHPSIYTVIKNEKTNPSVCWKLFGFPAKKLDNSTQFQRIEGFSSCHLCYQTFVYTSNTGTRNMLAHPCVKNTSQSKITTFTTTSCSRRINFDNMTKNYPMVKMNEREIDYLKNITCSWICHDMRSFKIIDDNGLKHLLQECVNLGQLVFLRTYLI